MNFLLTEHCFRRNHKTFIFLCQQAFSELFRDSWKPGRPLPLQQSGCFSESDSCSFSFRSAHGRRDCGAELTVSFMTKSVRDGFRIFFSLDCGTDHPSLSLSRCPYAGRLRCVFPQEGGMPVSMNGSVSCRGEGPAGQPAVDSLPPAWAEKACSRSRRQDPVPEPPAGRKNGQDFCPVALRPCGAGH